jgi:hypothetical protein
MADDPFLTSAARLIGRLGGAFYFDAATLSAGKKINVDGYRWYFLGRGGVLGDVEAPVVASAFGYFKPSLVAKMWDTGQERCGLTPRDANRLYLDCCHEFARTRFGGIDELDEFCRACRAIAVAADPAGLALYAGWFAQPLPADPLARAYQLVTVLRELRGSAHLLAVVASGLSPKVAHYLRRPGDFSSFGWSEPETPAVTDADRDRLAAADSLTDQIVAPWFSVLDLPAQDLVLRVLRQMKDRL